jgi:hypothetical protein
MREHKTDKERANELEEKRQKRKVSQPQYDQLKTRDKDTTDFALTQSLESHAALLCKAASDEQRASLLTQLQQSYGNTYVQRVVEHASTRGRQGTKEAVAADVSMDAIRVVDLGDGAELLFDLRASMDGEGPVPETTESTEKETTESAETEAEEEVEPIESSIGGAGTAEDAIQAEMGVFYMINPAKIDLGTAFGMAQYSLGGKTWASPRRLAAGSRYDVRARIACRYTWDTNAQGHKNISGPRDSDVTADSWSQIVYDLTPPATTPARPPRVEYWAQDMTIKHEKFHIQDWVGSFRTYRPTAEAWLNTQSASSVQEARNKTNDAISLMTTNVNNYMGSGDSSPAEARAYTDGVSSYQERADAVEARANKEGWEPGMIIEK